MRNSRIVTGLLLMLMALLSMRSSPAAAALYSQIALISVPLNTFSASVAPPPVPAALASSDIIWVDPVLHQLYIADRSNGAIDIINTLTNRFVAQITVPSPGLPNGVAADPTNGLIFYANGSNTPAAQASPGNSTLVMANGNVPGNVAVISTGGIGRADELAIDPVDKVVLVANDQDSPPFITEVSYANYPLLSIIGQIRLPQAIGIEQPVWDPNQRLFAVAFPSFNGTPAVVTFTAGAVGIAGSFRQVRTFSLPTCTGATGLALGPSEKFLVGCAPNPVIMDGLTGNVLATITQASNPDEVWFNPGNNQFLSVSNTVGSQNLTVINANNNQFIENDPVGPNHNVTADPTNNRVFVLARGMSATAAANPLCSPSGCIIVFGFQGAAVPASDAAVASVTSPILPAETPALSVPFQSLNILPVGAPPAASL